MKELFDDYLKNGLSDYDFKYLQTYKYVMLLARNNNINAYFANDCYTYFIEYPTSDNVYDSPLDVLKSEILLCKCDAGIIYENINNCFKQIAFIDLNENK